MLTFFLFLQLASSPCGEVTVGDGIVELAAPPSVGALWSLREEQCMASVGSLLGGRQGLLSVTVVLRRGPQDSLQIVRANLRRALDILRESGVPPHMVSGVVPVARGSQAAGLRIVFSERRKPRLAWLESLVGDVRIEALQATRAARRGDAVAPGQGLSTLGESYAVLRLADGSSLHLGPDATLYVVRVVAGANAERLVEIDVRQGTVEVIAAKGNGRFEVRTVTAIAGVRGTEFRVSQIATGTRLETLGGAVELESPKSAQQVEAGFGTLAHPDGRVEKPRSLLGAPTVRHPQRGPLHEGQFLQWEGIDNADQYRVSLARDPQFSSGLVGMQTKTPRTSLPPTLPQGTWYWRVFAIDADGFVGYPSKVYSFERVPP